MVEDMNVLKTITYGDIGLIICSILILTFLIHTYFRVAYLNMDIDKMKKLLKEHFKDK